MPNLQRIYQRSLRFGPFSEDQHICFNVVGRFLKIASEWHGAFSASLRIFVADDSANWRDWSSIHSPHTDAVQGSFCWNERWSIGIIGRVSCLSGLLCAIGCRTVVWSTNTICRPTLYIICRHGTACVQGGYIFYGIEYITSLRVCITMLYIRWSDVTESMATILSPFCGNNIA